MDIRLSGYNIDINFLNDKTISPENITASYAKISRSEKNIFELRKIFNLDIDDTRKFNKKIIFDMGHESVAEHVVFNFDISGISRLALEFLEHFRLASYTEKSQRYVYFDKNFYIPDEIDNPECIEDFKKIINLQFIYYDKLREKIKSFLLDKKNSSEISKEDARYILPLSICSQLGMTVNARELVYMINKLLYSDVMELKKIGNNLFENVKEIAPSLVQQKEKIFKIKKNTFSDFEVEENDFYDNKKNDVKLINYNTDFDDILISSIYYRYSSQKYSFEHFLKNIKNLSYENKLEFVKNFLDGIDLTDKLIREFEFVDFLFEAKVSASLFAQLKRHRMMTLTKNFYDIELKNTIPFTIKLIGEEKNFIDLIEKTNIVYEKLKNNYSRNVADYILTNSHRCKILFKIDARNLYNFFSLRLDKHAQWDIRTLAKDMCYLVKKYAPITMFLVSGKDKF